MNSTWTNVIMTKASTNESEILKLHIIIIIIIIIIFIIP